MGLNYFERKSMRFATMVVIGWLAISYLTVNTAFGQDAYFDGEKIVIPQVFCQWCWGQSLELEIVNSPDEYWVYPFTAKPIMQMFKGRYRNWTISDWRTFWDSPTQNPAIWIDNLFLVPRLEIDGAYYWVKFQYVDAWTGFGTLFKVVDYGEDDLDDDNDGIPDEIDPDPWRASSESDPEAIVGHWLLRRELFGSQWWSNLEGTPCAHLPPVTFIDIEIAYDASEGRYLIGSGGVYLQQTEPSPSKALYLQITLPGVDGYLETTLDLDINSPQLITGSERWSWISESGSCENNTGIIHAVRK